MVQSLTVRAWLAVSIAVLLGDPGRAPTEAAAPEPAASASGGFLAQVQEHLSEREYWATENGRGLQAPNRAQGLRTYFEKAGIRVHDRTPGEHPELLRLSLDGVGRGNALEPVPAGNEVVAVGNRVEVRRPGLVEWYLNSRVGIEQGFTLAERPVGEGPLVVELAVSGAEATPRGNAALLTTGAGRKLDYGAPFAEDARGRSLPAHLELPSSDRLRLVVVDDGASYPVVIDPLLTAAADAQVWGGQLEARLATSVASAGDVNGDGYADVIIGAPAYDSGHFREGAAFVFLGGASGIADGAATSPAAAVLESNQAGANFGWSVSGAGDVNGDGFADVIVGAPDLGAAFVFHGSSQGIRDGGPASASTLLESDQFGGFGRSVASAGDVNGDGYADVIVGAPDYDAPQTNEGAAFVFLGGPTGIANGVPATAAAQLESNQQGARFGHSVAGAGDVNGDGYGDVVVGAPNYADALVNEGTAWVFHGSAAGIGDGTPATAAATIEQSQAHAFLGTSVASAGDVNGDGYADVVVGAPFYDAGQTDEGAAFLYYGSASGIDTLGWQVLQTSYPSGHLGASVAGMGDVNGDGYSDLLVASPGWDFDDHPFPDVEDTGAVLLFLGGASGISIAAALRIEFFQQGAGRDQVVAGAGDVNGDGYADVIVGLPRFSAGQRHEGSALVYLGGVSGIAGDNTPLGWEATGRLRSAQESAGFGTQVAAAGDVNGDGYDDVIVGAPEYDAGQTDEGAAFVFHGSGRALQANRFLSNHPNGLTSLLAFQDPSMAATQLESDQAGALFGSVAGAGDVNGDGYADVIVGAPQYDAGQNDEGAAFVFHGSASGIADGTPATAAAQLESGQDSAWLGLSVAGAGDVNGDGYADVAVGAAFYDAGQGFGEGAVLVFHGGAAGVGDGDPATAPTRLESNQEGSAFGYGLGSAGDVNGDGYADLVVGAPFYDAGQTNEGAAFVFHGSATGIADGDPTAAATQLESDQEHAWLGWRVAGAGDVNGDGYADVIAGSPAYNAGQNSEGAAFIFHGSAAGVADGNPSSAATQLESNQEAAFFGWSVGGAGDVNGDGYADVIVGAIDYETGDSDEGAAFVFHGSSEGVADGSPASADVQLESDQAFAEFGSSVAGAGDVNGDGYADVVVGASQYENPIQSSPTDEGAAFVFLGSGDTRALRPRQRRGDGSGIAVAPWGASHSTTGFAVEITASHPAGAGRVRGEIEACPSGVEFGGESCSAAISAGWLSVNGAAPGVVISHTLAGLASDTLYRWRARVLHAPPTGPIPGSPAHGPWRRPTAQALDADVRVAPEPDLWFALASGGALLGALARHRRRGPGLAEADGNRTRRERVAALPTRFEVGARHQLGERFRGGA